MIYQNFQDNKLILTDDQAQRLSDHTPYLLPYAVASHSMVYSFRADHFQRRH